MTRHDLPDPGWILFGLLALLLLAGAVRLGIEATVIP